MLARPLMPVLSAVVALVLTATLGCSSKVATAIQCGAMEMPRQFTEPELASLDDGTPVCSFVYGIGWPVLVEPVLGDGGVVPGRGWVAGAEGANLDEVVRLLGAAEARRSAQMMQLELPSSPKWERFPPFSGLMAMNERGMLRVSTGEDAAAVVEVEDAFRFARNLRDRFPDRPLELYADATIPASKIQELMQGLSLAGVSTVHLRTAPPPEEGDQLLTANGGLVASIDDLVGDWDRSATYQDMVTLLAARS